MNNEKQIASLFNDTSFKAIFLNNPNVLAKMLCYISLNEDLLKDNNITIENNNLVVNKRDEKEKICDYILKVGNKIVANFELNKRYYKGLIKRNIAYIFTIYSSNLKKGEMYSNYEDLKITQINLNNFTRYKEAVTIFKMYSKETSEELSDSLTIVEIDIEKSRKISYNKNNKEALDKIIRLASIFEAKTIGEISLLLGDDILTMDEKDKFLKKIEEVNNNDDYLKEIKFENDVEREKSSIFETGKVEGIEQGNVQKEIELIISMLNNNIDISTITNITGKTKEEIELIKSNNIFS